MSGFTIYNTIILLCYHLHCYYHRLLCHSLHRSVILFSIFEAAFINRES